MAEAKLNKPDSHLSTSRSTGSFPVKRVVFKLVSLVIVAIVVIGVWWTILYINHRSVMSSINKNEYQAVFLTNGQAYFGKVANITTDYVKLTDIYYLQASQSATGVQPASSSSQSTSLSLVKLGNEIHGPEDEMFIARPQILFWENLKSSGKVVQAILHNQNQ